MNPATMSPAECYAKAQEEIARGDLAVAAQLLQVAILKAPGEARYRVALEQLREERLRRMRQEERAKAAAAPKASNAAAPPTAPAQAGALDAEIEALEEVVSRFPDEPEHLLRLACHLDRSGRTPEALVYSQKAVALAPALLETHLLELALHQRLGDRIGAERARREVRLVSAGDLALTRKARKRLEQLGWRDPAVMPLLPPAGQRLRAALLGMLLVAAGAGWWFGREPPPVEIDATGFQAVEPVARAFERQGAAEALLEIPNASWADLPMLERRTRLLALFEVAAASGYRRLVVHDATGTMLGLAEPEKVYLRQFDAGGEEGDFQPVEPPPRPPPPAVPPPAGVSSPSAPTSALTVEAR